MKKIMYIFIILLTLFSVSVNAAENDTCTKEELARLKELASKVEVNYDYEFKEVKQNGKISRYPIFSLTATNLNSDLKVMIIEDYLKQKYKEFKDGNKTSATLKNFSEGEKVNITIKAFVPNKCSGKTVGSKIIKIPYYNRYSEEEICFTWPNYKYCGQFYDSIISRKQFDTELVTYINSETNVEIEEKVDNGRWSLLMIIGISLGILLLITIIITIVIKRRKKNSI